LVESSDSRCNRDQLDIREASGRLLKLSVGRGSRRGENARAVCFSYGYEGHTGVDQDIDEAVRCLIADSIGETAAIARQAARAGC